MQQATPREKTSSRIEEKRAELNKNTSICSQTFPLQWFFEKKKKNCWLHRLTGLVIQWEFQQILSFFIKAKVQLDFDTKMSRKLCLCHVKNPKYYHTSIKFLFFICICVCFWQTVNHMKTQKFDFRQKIYWRLFEQKWKTFQMAGGALVIFDKQRKKLYHYI